MIDKQQLLEHYINQRLSSRECAELLGCNQKTILNYLKKYNIPSRPVSDNGSKSKYVVHTPEWNKKVSEALKRNNAMVGKFWEKHQNYKDGTRSYRQYFERGILGAFCVGCNTTTGVRKLVVHHIDGDRHHNTLDNLQVMCYSCHRKLHIRGKL
jgi:5-methylcytosine-specific restriction endonuclease McrA